MSDSCIIRPVEHKDFDGVWQLIIESSYGLSTLPKNKTKLEEKIKKSVQSFKKNHSQLLNDLYLFVLKDTRTQTIVGISGIVGDVSDHGPSYWYQCVSEENYSIHQRNYFDVLHLAKDRFQASQLCSLYLHPKYRRLGMGRFLSLARLLFIASHRSWFESHIITELRGISYKDGRCPFWDTVMAPFFNRTFVQADKLSYDSHDILDAHLPKWPLYVTLLPQHIQSVIGQVHPMTKGAESILSSEGFSKSNYIDIFDAGPKYTAPTDQVKAIKRTKLCDSFSISGTLKKTNLYLVASGKGSQFRCAMVPAKERGSSRNICLGQTSGLDTILKSGTIHSYMRLCPKVRRSTNKVALVLNNVSGLKTSSFASTFSNWYSHVSSDERYTFYR